MAVTALVPTFKSPLMELNGRVIQTLNVTVTANGAADSHSVATDLAKIDAIVGWAYIGAQPTQTTAELVQVPRFEINALGIGGAATNGTFGVQAATSVDFPSMSVTVLGRLGAQQ